MGKLVAAIGTLAVLGLMAMPGWAQQDRERDGKPGADRPHDRRPHADRDGRPDDRPEADKPERKKKRCGVTIRDILERHKKSDRKPNPKLISHLKEHFKKRHKGDRCHCRCDKKCKDKQADEERNRKPKDGKRGDDGAERDGKVPVKPPADRDGKHPRPRGPRGGATRR